MRAQRPARGGRPLRARDCWPFDGFRMRAAAHGPIVGPAQKRTGAKKHNDGIRSYASKHWYVFV
jgi:hypothetical protein